MFDKRWKPKSDRYINHRNKNSAPKHTRPGGMLAKPIDPSIQAPFLRPICIIAGEIIWANRSKENAHGKKYPQRKRPKNRPPMFPHETALAHAVRTRSYLIHGKILPTRDRTPNEDIHRTGTPPKSSPG